MVQQQDTPADTANLEVAAKDAEAQAKDKDVEEPAGAKGSELASNEAASKERSTAITEKASLPMPSNAEVQEQVSDPASASPAWEKIDQETIPAKEEDGNQEQKEKEVVEGV